MRDLAVTRMEFCLLGPLEVRCGGAAVPVPAGKQRAVLAMLLLNAGQVVGPHELAEVLWADGPPPSGRLALQNHVLRLRRALGTAGPARITTQPNGYQIRVETGELDVARFEVLVRQARTSARDSLWADAGRRAEAAIALWRGEPLADAGSEVLTLRELPRLAELQLQALELRIEANLRQGGHSEVIGELRKLTGAHPLREHLHALLMLALYQDGRQGEALAAYQHARALLVEELGTEPGPRLRLLQQQILSAHPVLAGPPSSTTARSTPAAADSGPVVPRQLPGTVRHFTGRSAELTALTSLLKEDGEPPAIVISAIGGTAGVGKTALAVHWANQVTARFPDGQLYVNLRGYDNGQPMTTGEALARFLRALGIPGRDIPSETDERAAQYQSLLAGRRVLVLLDNAMSVAQVRLLVAASPSCTTVVTSRDALTGLVARDGAVRLDLDLLPEADAVTLLCALIGVRATDDPEATAALAGRCVRLPLALRVAAELAAARPKVPLTHLVAELADRQRLLDLLDAGGDPQTAVRAVFSWSCRHLPGEVLGMFWLLGLHPGPDLDAHAAAAPRAWTC
jgi:DNA-binding SARP family transcriptional activator